MFFKFPIQYTLASWNIVYSRSWKERAVEGLQGPPEDLICMQGGHLGGGAPAYLSSGTLSPEASSEPASGAMCRGSMPLIDRRALLNPGHHSRPETKMNNIPVDVPGVSTEHCFGKLLPKSSL